MRRVPKAKWYEGVTPYMWLVLVIASLGWIFDTFEGQIFVATMQEMTEDLLKGDSRGARAFHGDIAFAVYLVGGALGGVLFGAMSDRIGRTRTMMVTILVYSLFTCLTALANAWWQVITLRFLVALGTGGEWAVASAMVAEVFPQRARAWSLGLFHASSVLGTWTAALTGALVASDRGGWRWAFVVGAGPALLTLWIRWKLREPERWIQARLTAQKDHTQPAGRISDLFAPGIRKHAFLGISLAMIGLSTFWGVHVYGKNLLRQAAERAYLPASEGPADAKAGEASLKALSHEAKNSIKDWEMLGMFLVTSGGGLGLISFGPACERLGRRGAFLVFHFSGLAAALIAFQLLAGASKLILCVALPIFGYCTLALHAGYAIYFPELFPTRLRATGAGFCFNGGRLLAASVLILRGSIGTQLSPENTASILSLLFLVGMGLLLFAPETKGRELPM